MKRFVKDKINNILRDQGLKAGSIPVENLENDPTRLLRRIYTSLYDYVGGSSIPNVMIILGE